MKGNFKKADTAIENAINKMVSNTLNDIEQPSSAPRPTGLLDEIRQGITLKKVKKDCDKKKDILPDPEKLEAERQKDDLINEIDAKRIDDDSESESDFSSEDESENENNETKVVEEQKTIEKNDKKNQKIITPAPTVNPKRIGGIIGAFVNKFENLSKNDAFIKPSAENKTVVKEEKIVYINNNCDQNRMKFCGNAKDLLQAILRRNPDYQKNIEKSSSTNILNDNKNN